MNEPFVIERTYNASVERVWKAISDRDEMEKWYFKIADFKPEVGCKFTFYGGEEGGFQYVHLCEVKEVVKERKLSYSWRYEGYEGNSLVTFELFPEGDKTRVKLSHSGLETFPAIDAFKKTNFVAGWTAIIGTSLLDFVEKLFITNSFETQASAAAIWEMLTTTDIVNQWAQAFGNGVLIETNWKPGGEVLWKDGEGNIGVKGLIVAKENEGLLEFGYYDEISDAPPKPLGEYSESFAIEDRGDKRIVTMKAGPLPEEHFVAHKPLWDKAVTIMKDLAEKS